MRSWCMDYLLVNAIAHFKVCSFHGGGRECNYVLFINCFMAFHVKITILFTFGPYFEIYLVLLIFNQCVLFTS